MNAEQSIHLQALKQHLEKLASSRLTETIYRDGATITCTVRFRDEAKDASHWLDALKAMENEARHLSA